MVIEKIELNHFRNYQHLSFEPHEGINLFFGKNGSGKTNLLEAIHYCALGKSHRVSQDAPVIFAGEKAGSCFVTVRSKLGRNEIGVRLQPGDAGGKCVLIDRKKVKKLSDMMGVLRCVIFSPEDLDLIKEGPAVRRRFLDMMISQISRGYFVALQQYRGAMEQRNAILRNSRLMNQAPDPMIEDFEAAMAEQADTIYRERKKIADMMGDEIPRIYQEISGRKDELFQIQYHGFLKRENEQIDAFKRMLRDCREDDQRLGMTSVGPHRDDLHLSLNRKSMKMFASQGQMRTAALSLKLVQLRILTKVSGESPVLLLDDVMSELDLNRRMNLLREIGDIQTFITFSDEGDLDPSQIYRTYAVSSSDGEACIQEIKSGPEVMKTILKEPDFT
ncbi:MAG: DNA replication/repair protein RecF [Clostridia bacterium]|nr:DNA replication/repair protein RecF [Clostridia bacterium]